MCRILLFFAFYLCYNCYTLLLVCHPSHAAVNNLVGHLLRLTTSPNCFSCYRIHARGLVLKTILHRFFIPRPVLYMIRDLYLLLVRRNYY